MNAARQLVSRIVPAASFPERERLILIAIRELTRRILASELEALDALLPEAFAVGGTVVRRHARTIRTIHSPVGELVVNASEYRSGEGEQTYVWLLDASGCGAGMTPALFELLVNGVPAVDIPPPPVAAHDIQAVSTTSPDASPETMAVTADPIAQSVSASRAESSAEIVAVEAEMPPEAPPARDPASSRPPNQSRKRAREDESGRVGDGRTPPPTSYVVDDAHPWWDEATFREPQGIERREHVRARVELAIGFGSEHGFYGGLTADISEGGVFIATHRLHEVGSELEFAVSLPTCESPVRGIGRVQWVREYREESETSPGMGLKFLSVSPEDLARIREYIREHEALLWLDTA